MMPRNSAGSGILDPFSPGSPDVRRAPFWLDLHTLLPRTAGVRVCGAHSGSIHQAAATNRRTGLAIRGVLCSLRLGLAGISAGDRDSCALQGRQQGLKPLVGRLIDREGILYACLAEDYVAVPVLVGARHSYR